MKLFEIGKALKAQRIALGLTQLQVAKLSGLSRTTVVLLENGHLDDIGFVKLANAMSILGLNIDGTQAKGLSNALAVAARTAGTSYKATLSESELLRILRTGNVATQFAPHVETLLDETPLPLVVQAIFQTAKTSKLKTSTIMQNVSKLAGQLGAYRKVW